jgi:hypothetical protein
MLNIKNAEYRIKQDRPNAGPRYTYVFICSYPGCVDYVRVRSDALKTHSGRCSSHSHVKRPFESIYNGLHKDWRKIKVELTYEQFLKFTKIMYCHYCGDRIPWRPFATVKGFFHSAAYFLDRKDNKKSYSTSNCVVCCSECNRIKGNRFSYKEFLIVGKALYEIRYKRERKL